MNNSYALLFESQMMFSFLLQTLKRAFSSLRTSDKLPLCNNQLISRHPWYKVMPLCCKFDFMWCRLCTWLIPTGIGKELRCFRMSVFDCRHWSFGDSTNVVDWCNQAHGVLWFKWRKFWRAFYFQNILEKIWLFQLLLQRITPNLDLTRVIFTPNLDLTRVNLLLKKGLHALN